MIFRKTALILFLFIVAISEAQNETINGNLTINSTADVGASQNPALVIGQRSGHHIGIDGNEIGAFYNNSFSNVYINCSLSTSNTVLNDGGGKIGMGTPYPSELLHISARNSGDGVIRLESDLDNNNEGDNIRIEMYQDGGLHGALIGFNQDWPGSQSDNIFRIVTRQNGINDYSTLTIDPFTSFVGIGTTEPDSKLTVKGKVHAQEVKLDLVGSVAPDYVFKEGYNLKSLEEVERHIKDKGHLPNIPSAREMEEEGIDMKEMNLKLLEKIEELTLYIIEQQNLIKQQKEYFSGEMKKMEYKLENLLNK
ncbi:hypothetical protein HX109_10935 [Galbibacter sp. BG1]|uniref:tail fiber protein n=1 Tax=Galbibacter sp. BG1 TaxID=1170699 RepID=UPI0015BD71C2|nr:tail fiber protein [Galbibacter sp. BG1]QLE02043.1 hypothetical protein HX109_10935 [Galbibacter sp. BG1]